MSYKVPTVGDNYHRGWNSYRAQPINGYTPAVGDLVQFETGGANQVDLIAGIEAITAIVDFVAPDASYVTITELVAGSRIELPYSGTVNRGDKVKFQGASDTVLGRTTVQTDNSNGTGFVLAVDADAPHGTGYCVVRFSA